MQYILTEEEYNTLQRKSSFHLNALGTAEPDEGSIITFPKNALIKDSHWKNGYPDVPCIQALIDNTLVWIPLLYFKGNQLGSVNRDIEEKCWSTRDAVPLLQGRTVILTHKERYARTCAYDWV
jgi:hypothetical protein